MAKDAVPIRGRYAAARFCSEEAIWRRRRRGAMDEWMRAAAGADKAENWFGER